MGTADVASIAERRRSRTRPDGTRASVRTLTRVAVVHADPLLREDVSNRVSDDDLTVVASLDALDGWSDAAPDVLVLAHRAPGTSAIDLCTELRPGAAGPAVVIVAAEPKAVLLRRAVQHGALGFVAAESPPHVLREAVRWAAGGRAFVDPAVSHLVHELVARPPAGKRPYGLTRAELEVVALLPKGMPNREIAAELGITENTVKTHLRHALRKLGVRDRAQAAALVVREGLA